MELFAEAYQQLASISAVLGGLAFTAAASLLAGGVGTSALDALRRPAKITVGTALASAVSLVGAALMWSLMVADIRRALARGEYETAQHFAALNWIPSIALIVGTGLFFASIAASGWIASRRLGLVSTAMGVLGAIALVWMMSVFADVR